PLTRRTGVGEVDVRRVADDAVGANLRFVVAAGILPVGDVYDVRPVAADVVGGRQPRHDAVAVDADDVAGRGQRLDVFEARAEIEGPVAVDRPVILHERRTVVDVHRAAARRREEVD